MVEEVLAGIASDTYHFIGELQESGQELGVGGICRQRDLLPLNVCE